MLYKNQSQNRFNYINHIINQNQTIKKQYKYIFKSGDTFLAVESITLSTKTLTFMVF